MTLLTIRLFGELSAVDHRGDALSIGSRRTQAAIVWLALHLDSEAPLRDFEALFGDDARPCSRATSSTPSASSRTRLLEGDGPMLRLSASAVDVDALRLQELDANGSIPALREAADLYRGNLLEGFSARSRLRRMARRRAPPLLARRRRHLRPPARRADQAPAGGRTRSRPPSRLLSLDPTQEVVHRTLMRLQLEQGRPDAALRRYQECADILRREFSREPSAETEKVREEISPRSKRSPAPREVVPQSARPPGARPLVEDDLVSSALVEGFLNEAGYEVVTVADGADALMEIGTPHASTC